MDWKNVFDHVILAAPATNADIEYLQSGVLAPLTSEEIANATSRQRNPFPVSNSLHATYKPFDPAKWTLPGRRFPSAFVDLLRWSNGGNFTNGERELGVFGTASLREFLLSYELPEYMRGAVPFAFDGGGGFYLFDMRADPQGDEFPIVFSHSGSLGWGEDEHISVAATFLDACLGTSHPRD